MQAKHPLYRCYETVLDMLGDRGYAIDPLQKLDQKNFLNTISVLNHTYKFIFRKKNNQDWAMQVFFVKQTVNSESSNLGKKDIEVFKKIMEKNKTNAAILILLNIDVTSYASREMESLKPNFWIECFNAKSVQINITKHHKVPPHFLMAEEDKRLFLQKYSLQIGDILKMERTDPVALYFGAQPGQVFRIEKTSESNGIYNEYRVVI